MSNSSDRISARERREELGLSREKLARLADVSSSTIVRLETEGHTPKVAPLARIAKALGVSMQDLLPEDQAAVAESVA